MQPPATSSPTPGSPGAPSNVRVAPTTHQAHPSPAAVHNRDGAGTTQGVAAPARGAALTLSSPQPLSLPLIPWDHLTLSPGKPLAQGTFGTIHLGTLQGYPKPVAIKLMRDLLGVGPSQHEEAAAAVQAFWQEAELMYRAGTATGSPHIMRLHGAAVYTPPPPPPPPPALPSSPEAAAAGGAAGRTGKGKGPRKQLAPLRGRWARPQYALVMDIADTSLEAYLAAHPGYTAPLPAEATATLSDGGAAQGTAAAGAEADVAAAAGRKRARSQRGQTKPAPTLAPPHGIPIRTRLLWALDLARAVAALHAAGILHLDIKPENILLTHMLANSGLSGAIGGARAGAGAGAAGGAAGSIAADPAVFGRLCLTDFGLSRLFNTMGGPAATGAAPVAGLDAASPTRPASGVTGTASHASPAASSSSGSSASSSSASSVLSTPGTVVAKPAAGGKAAAGAAVPPGPWGPDPDAIPVPPGAAGVVATPLYSDPTLMWEGVGPEADVWSFALTMYQIITGLEPFEGTPVADLWPPNGHWPVYGWYLPVFTAMMMGEGGLRPRMEADTWPVHLYKECPGLEAATTIMTSCWDGDRRRRPTMAQVVAMLEACLGMGTGMGAGAGSRSSGAASSGSSAAAGGGPHGPSGEGGEAQRQVGEAKKARAGSA